MSLTIEVLISIKINVLLILIHQL